MKIQLKRSNALDNGKAKEPTAEQMEYGELAVNFNADDPAVFIKDNDDNIIRIGGVGNIADDGQTEIPSNITPPTDPKPGNFWYNPDDGRLYYYYEDTGSQGRGASSQWVDASPDSQSNPVESGPTFPATALPDDLFFNTTDGRLYIYYKDSDSEQWVDASPDIQPITTDLWTEAGGYLSPKTGTNGVDIGGSKILLNAADGSAEFAGGYIELSQSGRSSFKRDWGSGREATVSLACGFANNKAGVAITDSIAHTTDQANIKLYADGTSQFAGDMAIGTTGSFTPSTPAISLNASNGSGNFEGTLQCLNKKVQFLPRNSGYSFFLRDASSVVKFSIIETGDTTINGLLGVYGPNADGYSIYSGGNIAVGSGTPPYDYPISLNADGNIIAAGDIQSTSQNGGQLAGCRNQIINGDFRIWQRGSDFTSPPDLSYTADRWSVAYTSSRVIRTTDAPSGFSYSIGMYAAGRQSVAQPIELLRTGGAGLFAIGTTWTLSFYLRGDSGAGSINACVRFTEDRPGTNSVDVLPYTLTNFDNTWTRYSHTFTITSSPAATSTALSVIFDTSGGGSIGSNGTMSLSGVQLEPGPVATPFEHRPIGTELALCQRYYQTLSQLYLYSAADTSAQRRAYNPRPVFMRANPTETGTAPNGTISFVTSPTTIRINGVAPTPTEVVTVNQYTADAEL